MAFKKSLKLKFRQIYIYCIDICINLFVIKTTILPRLYRKFLITYLTNINCIFVDYEKV